MRSPKSNRALHAVSHAVVTGGSSGIGKACIEAFFSINPAIHVLNVSRRTPELARPGRLSHLQGDLTEAGNVERVIGQVRAVLSSENHPGKVILLNNSGFGSLERFERTDPQRHLAMIDLNVRACVHLAQGLLPVLRERGGAIVNIASTAAFQPTPSMAVYGATKAFLLHWSLALRQELRGSGVNVLAICPGPTRTEFFRAAGFTGRFGPDGFSETPEAVAATVVRALERGGGLAVSGWSNALLARFSALLPKTWSAALAGRVLNDFRRRGDAVRAGH